MAAKTYSDEAGAEPDAGRMAMVELGSWADMPGDSRTSPGGVATEAARTSLFRADHGSVEKQRTMEGSTEAYGRWEDMEASACVRLPLILDFLANWSVLAFKTRPLESACSSYLRMNIEWNRAYRRDSGGFRSKLLPDEAVRWVQEPWKDKAPDAAAG